MTVGNSTGLTSVTGTVTSTPTAHTVVNLPIAANGTFGTVGVGKSWRIIHATIAADVATTNYDRIRILNDGTPILSLIVGGWNNNSRGNNSVSLSGTYETPIAIVAAGKAVTLDGVSASNATANIVYVEV